MEADTPTCPRHPGVETRLRCSRCDTLICPGCGVEAAVGYKCPDCVQADHGGDDASTAGDGFGRWLAGLGGKVGSAGRAGSDKAPSADEAGSTDEAGSADNAGSTGDSRPGPASRPSRPRGDRLAPATAVRGTAAGLVAAAVGGLLLGPILTGGTFLLISAGVIGWGVARAVFWATEEKTSPYLRAIALTAAGFSVAVGLVSAGAHAAPAGLAFLAYPAAMYGGWIVVRQR